MASVLRRALFSGVVRSAVRCSAGHAQSRCASSLPQQLQKVIEYGEMYPDLLPDPDVTRRHYLREALERKDMLRRRSVLDIPEFYVGSYMAITVSDQNAPGKQNKFVGICIYRRHHGTRHQVALRNIVEHEGVEMMYDLYSPLVLEVQVLRLQKRLDKDLTYLRDALPEYSTVPWNTEPEQHPEGTPVPVDETRVVMKPKPWTQRWERKELKGVAEWGIRDDFHQWALERSKPWEKYDLMKEYRSSIPLEDQNSIWNQVEEHRKTVEEQHKRNRRRKLLQTRQTISPSSAN